MPLLLALAFCLVVPSCAAPRAATAELPNIVILFADDMGYGDPGCHNAESKIATPHIDRIAQQGMLFTDAHAPGAYCIPSRYGLLTGRYPMRNRFQVRRSAAIAKDQITIARLLKSRGYATAMVGKWHLGFDGGPNYDWQKPMPGGPVDCGFDEFFGIHASLDIPPYYYIRNRHAVAPPTGRIEARNTAGWTKIQGEFWRAGGVAEGFVHAEVLPRFESEAVAFLDRRGKAKDGRPFFLYLASPAPHTPWLPTKPFRKKSEADMYGDFVMQVDHTVGQVLAALDRNGLAENTLVIFTSDNGPVWYPTDEKKFGHHSTGQWRGMKSDSWEGGHRMPFVARWPRAIRASSKSDQTICFTDMLATFAEVTDARLTRAQTRDSVSFLPLLRGIEKPVRDETILCQGKVIRQGRWKLINHLGSGGFSKPRRIKPKPGGPKKGQLYDLKTDPSETNNLWSKHPEIVAQLSERLAASRR